MKFLVFSLSTALVTSLSFLPPVLAESVSFYSGGGYSVKIFGFAGSASYTGSSSKYRLRVFNPSGKVLLNQFMAPR
ncbi:hypothetical protein NIES4101_50190 [Calothrix sp. NIES-4101]|nr:hypothetical protein NIES4101_50190 [Calothrix sp. NIES-4101]